MLLLSIALMPAAGTALAVFVQSAYCCCLVHCADCVCAC